MKCITTLEELGYNVGGFGCESDGTQPITFYTSSMKDFIDSRYVEFERNVLSSTGTSNNGNTIKPAEKSTKHWRKQLRKHLQKCWDLMVFQKERKLVQVMVALQERKGVLRLHRLRVHLIFSSLLM
ncbi:hypothetical protein SNE40_004022 [Patella caerulea]|uniref:Uncharacterized protein n=1 Tax=Patella caerulea TaxID=87958 RepID=A0AAN8QG59_PATCE